MNASETETTPENRRLGIIQLAREQLADEGRVEIDDDAVVSDGDDDGCYVAAWVWVAFEGTQFDKEKEKETEKPAGACLSVPEQ